MKRPSFQFYPSDWLRDTALRSCSTGARGLWMDMICYMHEGNPYGFLKVGNKVILPDNLARMTGETLANVNAWLDELHDAGVYDFDDNRAIYSRRMIRDEALRNIRAEGGKLGGNPNLKVNHKVNLEDKQKPTPSSSSSSSSSININVAKATKAQRLSKDFILPTEWIEFCRTERKDLSPESVFAQFKDYWIAQGGQKGAKLDWFATWRNWVRNTKATFLKTQDKPVEKRWFDTIDGIKAKGAELGIDPSGCATIGQYEDMIRKAM